MRRALPLALFYLAAGALHFARPRMYEAIIPRLLPAKRQLVYASGAAEIAGGAGVLHPATRRPAGWWLIATLVAVFPANVSMAVNAQRFRGIPEPLLWLRLPLQAVLIAWAYGATNGPGRRRTAPPRGWFKPLPGRARRRRPARRARARGWPWTRSASRR